MITCLNPEAEHYLDWFHITMRLTVMGQYAKALDATQERREETLKSLESVKHYLWHGNVARARDRIEDIHCFLDNEELTGENSRKLRKALDEFDHFGTNRERSRLSQSRKSTGSCLRWQCLGRISPEHHRLHNLDEDFRAIRIN